MKEDQQLTQQAREEKSLTTDIAIGFAPAVAVVAGKLTDHFLRPQDDAASKVELPPGVQSDKD